ncbi:TPA: nucleoside-diphosphate sugar epimerase/dehydratase, partial [Aeromonas veronii]
KHTELFPLYQLLKSIVKSASSSLVLKPQELLDYRMYLLGAGYRFDDQRLYKILSLGKKHNNRFAIYGAGDIGRRIYNILQAADITPVCFFDKDYTKKKCTCKIPILMPDKINFTKINAVIIASDAYYQEIYTLVKSMSSDIDVV